MHAVSLTIAEHPAEKVVVRTDGASITDQKISCKFAGSNIPLDNPWRKDKEIVPESEKYLLLTREPPECTEGVVTWTLHFQNVSKDSQVFGRYNCELDNVKSSSANLILAGE